MGKYHCPVHGVFEVVTDNEVLEVPCPSVDHTYCWRAPDGMIVTSQEPYEAPPVRCDGPSVKVVES